MAKENEQLSFVEEHTVADNGPVVCLGMTFKNEDERREYFRNELRKKLPKLKNIEGFPIGEDEDIIALSDPPYYTACPNPWINDFIKEWELEKEEKYDRDISEIYHREPFVADVSEGKNDLIYTAHSYHTKVPYKAIIRYILNFTQPGDIVLDGFSGTGMTGVAGEMAGNSQVISELGYYVESGKVLDENKYISDIGKRHTILNDLSPIAAFISSNYNTLSNADTFKDQADIFLEEIESKYGWMYETIHSQTEIGKINYTIWSDVFACPHCSNEIVFWDEAVEDGTQVLDTFNCSHCNSELNKRNLEKVLISKYDSLLKQTIELTKQVPVLINYSVGKKRYEKRPDDSDLDKIKKIELMELEYDVPKNSIPKGEKTTELHNKKITHVHHFYTKRNLIALSALFYKLNNNKLKFLFTSTIVNLGKTARYKFKRSGNVPMSGTIYVSSLTAETNVFHAMRGKLKQVYNLFNFLDEEYNSIVTNGTITDLKLDDNSIDYIFTDPPFGSNLMYSELNYIWESWLKVFTNQDEEAIVNKVQNKTVLEYKLLMEKSFKEYFRVLKPGRWITIEFSNSKASVWNAIQESILKAGFIIANVSALDKKQGSFNAVTSTTAVKQDLVISAYKPTGENIRKIKDLHNTEDSAWAFVEQYLDNLTVFKGAKGSAEIISERTPRILFDRMVSYHVQNSLTVPISSAEFQARVAVRFPMRDGMAFLESQVAEYDKKRTLVKEFSQLSLFVSDETSAIEWIRQQLMKKPQSRQDIHPNFMKEIQHIAKHELLPELDDLLYQNFLHYDGDGQVPDQIVSYLRRTYKDLRGLDKNDSTLIEKAKNRWYVPDPTKQADLEKLREKSLLREFEGYLEEMEGTKKKLRQFRTEAIRAGFKKAYTEKDFNKIVKVGERLPENIIQEDDKLLMYYDNACIRLGL